MAGLSKLAKPFRSTLAEFAKKHKMEAMPGKQWEAYIKANAPKDAKKEAEAAGLYKMLDKYEGKVTKGQIAEHLEKKLPKIKTKEKTSGPKFTQKDIQDAASYEEPITLDGDRYVVEATDNGYSLMDINGNPVRNERSSGDLAYYINEKYAQPSPYEGYTLPGGEDYQETLIQLQRQAPDELPEGYKVRELDRNGQKFYQALTPSTLGREYNTPELANLELKRYADNIFKSQDFQSSHFKDEPNILAHIRTKQRELPTGERVHFLEELQSDWGQAAREGKIVPEAPYIGSTEDWTKLALKKAIEQAAEGGQDYLAWTTGPQQAQRYSLSQAIKSLNYDPAQNILRGYDPEGEISIFERMPPEDIPNWIGKEPAQALLQTTPDELGLHRLRGVELDVGGHGMNTYYDQIVPSVANDLMKQLGLPERVAPIQMETGMQPGLRISPELRRKVMEEGLPYFSLGAAPLATDENVPAFGKGGVVRSSIEELRKMIENLNGVESGKRVQEAADSIPNLEKQYSQKALRQAFTGGGDNASGLMIMNPRSFENYARPLYDEYVEPTYIKELGGIARTKGFDDVPFLMLNRQEIPDLSEDLQLPRHMRELKITGHEGRHRTRALTDLGDERTLVRMIPRASMREHLPRYSQQEYIDALRQELGTFPMVRPEADDEGVRAMRPLPRIFAKGGRVQEESITQQIPRYIRKGQYRMAGALGLRPEVEYATEIPERYYPANEQHLGRGDAMRHLLLQAQLQQKYGEIPARMIGAAHEWLSGGQTESEAKQDEINNAIGIQIGKESKDLADATYRAWRAVEEGRVNVPTLKERQENNYAEGGEVDLDQQYEFIDNSKNFAPTTEVDYDAMYDFK